MIFLNLNSDLFLNPCMDVCVNADHMHVHNCFNECTCEFVIRFTV